jgi:hypothetical protein
MALIQRYSLNSTLVRARLEVSYERARRMLMHRAIRRAQGRELSICVLLMIECLVCELRVIPLTPRQARRQLEQGLMSANNSLDEILEIYFPSQ